MSKILKSFLIASLVVCMTVCLGIFAAACNNEPDDSGYVTIKVVLPDADSTPVANAAVGVCTMNGSLTTCLDEAGVTDSNGILKFDVTDYADTTQFLIKLHDLPAGYIYADENGDEYTGGNGMLFDTEELNSTTFTVILTKLVENDTVSLELDKVNSASASFTANHVKTVNNYSFKATESATYLFTVSNFDESWTLGTAEIKNNFAELEMEANEVVNLTLDEDCKVLVNDLDSVHDMENPVETEVGEEVSFSVMLVSAYDRQHIEKTISWGLPGGYSLSFETKANEAGSYKVTYTSSFENDNLELSMTVLEGYDYPYLSGNNTFKNVLANKPYRLDLNGNADYSSLKAGDVINYTITIEYIVDEGGTGEAEYEEIVLGNSYNGDETIYTLVVETDGEYTFSISTTLYDLVVAKSVDNLMFGDIDFKDANWNYPESKTVELEAGTYYLMGYDGTFTVTAD